MGEGASRGRGGTGTPQYLQAKRALNWLVSVAEKCGSAIADTWHRWISGMVG